MEKVDIILEVPVLNCQYEFEIPLFIKIGGLLPLIVDAVISLSDYVYQRSGYEYLTSLRLQKILEDEKTLGDYGINNGEHLILL